MNIYTYCVICFGCNIACFFKQFITNTFEKRETKVGNRHSVVSWKHTVIIIIIPKWCFLFHHKWAVQCTNITNMQLTDFCEIRKYIWNITCFPSVRFVNIIICCIWSWQTISQNSAKVVSKGPRRRNFQNCIYFYVAHAKTVREREWREIEREERKKEREKNRDKDVKILEKKEIKILNLSQSLRGTWRSIFFT